VDLSLKEPHSSPVQLKVYNILGQPIYAQHLTVTGQYQHQIDISQYNSGVYLLEISSAGQRVTKKFVKE
jgi:hypothetical protein